MSLLHSGFKLFLLNWSAYRSFHANNFAVKKKDVSNVQLGRRKMSDKVEGASAVPKKTNKIHLIFRDGTGYVFKADDYKTLRQKHHIVGSLVGTRGVKCSTTKLTLPVKLTPIETRLLVEKGIALLVAKKMPSSSDSLQNALEEKIADTSGPQQLPPGISCTHKPPQNLEVVPPPQIDNPLKYRVFCELWSHGCYITADNSFGADFLLYFGDPEFFHASHIIILSDTPDIDPQEIVSKTRLSETVHKTCVFAFFAEDTASVDKVVHYKSVEWEEKCDKAVQVPEITTTD